MSVDKKLFELLIENNFFILLPDLLNETKTEVSRR